MPDALKQTQANGSADASGAANKKPMKTAAVLAAVMLIEAAAIGGSFFFMSGPAKVKADDMPNAAAQAAQPVEMEVVHDRFQNTRSGRAYVYDTDIYVVVQKQNKAAVSRQLKMYKAQISTDISMIFRRAKPSTLLEPDLATLTREIRAVLDKQVGRDAEEKPLIQEVLIRKCMQYRADM